MKMFVFSATLVAVSTTPLHEECAADATAAKCTESSALLQSKPMRQPTLGNLQQTSARRTSMLNSDACACFPEEGNRDHLRSPCRINPNDIPLPGMVDQQTANCPFLGTLVNEGVIANDWIVNETLFRATTFVHPGTVALPNVLGHFAGNFRDHSKWVDRNVGGADDECVYWYLNPLNMEGMSNEHIHSTGISDCPTDWTNCAFDCDTAGEWKCQPLNDGAEHGVDSYQTCKAALPNADRFNEFVGRLVDPHGSPPTFDENDFVTTCQLDAFQSTVDGTLNGGSSDVVEDRHLESVITNACAKFPAPFDGLEHVDGAAGGGSTGGSIVGGYKDLVHYFGQLDGSCDDGSEKFKIKVKDLRRIDIERKFPCDFERNKLFTWMFEYNPLITDRRDAAWIGCP